MGTGICSLNRSVGLCEQVKSCGIVVGYETGIGRNGKAVGAKGERKRKLKWLEYGIGGWR